MTADPLEQRWRGGRGPRAHRPERVLGLLRVLVLVLPAFGRQPSRPRTSLRRPLFLECDQDSNTLALFLPKKSLVRIRQSEWSHRPGRRLFIAFRAHWSC